MSDDHELMPKTVWTRLDIWWQHHRTSPKRWRQLWRYWWHAEEPTARWARALDPHAEDESPLVSHARRELERCGQTAEDPEFAESLIAAVAAFSSYGHSGGSAFVGVEMLSDLLRYRVLSPLTADPDEWMDVAEVSGTALWQSRRQPDAFSTDGGATWYSVDEPGVFHDSATTDQPSEDLEP